MTPDDYECQACHGSMHVPDGMDPLEPEVRFCSDCMVVELERLQAIVDRLPKTADGVPVTPGDKIWGKSTYCDPFPVIVSAEIVVIFSDGEASREDAPYYYSTSEAAEKARQSNE